MKSKRKFKIKAKFVIIAVVVIAIGLVISSSKLIRVEVSSDTIGEQEASSNFKDVAASSAISLTDIKNNKAKDLILFTASWCGSCNKLTQDLSQLAQTYPNINIYIKDLEANRDDANALDVPITPTLVLLENGETKNYPEVTIDNISSIVSDFNRIGIR